MVMEEQPKVNTARSSYFHNFHLNFLLLFVDPDRLAEIDPTVLGPIEVRLTENGLSDISILIRLEHGKPDQT